MRPALPSEIANGGYFEPPPGVPARLLRARHAACGIETRVRLPESVPAEAVRRLQCGSCAQAFAPVELSATGRLRVSSLRPPTLDPQGRVWRLVSVPVAAVAVVTTLLLIRGSGEEPAAAPVDSAQAGTPSAHRDAAEPAADRARAGTPSRSTKLVRGSSYSLALPAGWQRTDPGGATFAAISADGDADATLWIDEDPKLDFAQFIDQALAQLRSLAGSARIVERVPAPTPEATIVRLAADAPEGQPTYEVTLRAAGDYRYYLATSVQPGATRRASRGAELIAGSLTPEAVQ